MKPTDVLKFEIKPVNESHISLKSHLKFSEYNIMQLDHGEQVEQELDWVNGLIVVSYPIEEAMFGLLDGTLVGRKDYFHTTQLPSSVTWEYNRFNLGWEDYVLIKGDLSRKPHLTQERLLNLHERYKDGEIGDDCITFINYLENNFGAVIIDRQVSINCDCEIRRCE